ncbi:hypothetical protein [Vogesella sp. XCS3]|uniref:hypothetical protein n=1 Tax=Vogesella sp. XCS3 TaxID=2877939 RepID=UPI001D0AC211|nr:hypothetical protein [Vogesella sp. XCS3]UDM18988.1 hypothetical protein LCH97_18260 [Vogesella sp. XCS3]
MSRVLFGNLVIELQWENLLGLNKESDEVRELAAGRNGSKQYLVVQNALGSRVAGLADLAANVRKTEFFALAGLLRAVTDDQNIVFLHTDPDDISNFVFIAIQDGKPESDRVLPRAAAIDAAIDFIQKIGAGVTILGDIDDSQIQVTRHVNLEDIATSLTDEEKSGYKLNPLPSKGFGGLLLLIVALSILGGGYWWWADVAEKEAQAKIAEATAAQPDPVVEYKAQLQNALKLEPLSSGVAYAKAVETIILGLPSEVGGWKVNRLLCKEKTCMVIWVRREGGTFETILAQRQNTQFQDMNTAVENITFFDSPGSGNEVSPVSRELFYMKAGVRMQTLEDAGKQIEKDKKLMNISLSKLEPIAPLPVSLKRRSKSVEVISKGDWSMKGHLAFIDSVSGLMAQAGNMSLTEVSVVLDEKSPEFTAQGKFYVK